MIGSGDTTRASPEELQNNGVASIPADRYAYGLAGGLPIVDNFCVGHMRHGGYGAWWRARTALMRQATERAVCEMRYKGFMMFLKKPRCSLEATPRN